jgi:hypothetical protein
MTAVREAPAARVREPRPAGGVAGAPELRPAGRVAGAPEPRPAHATGRLVGVRGRLILGATDVLAEDLRRLEPALKWRIEPRRAAHR